MPSSSNPRTPRKKGIVKRWLQIRRIKKKAKGGPPASAVNRELYPIIERILDEESIANSSSPEISDLVRIRALEGAEWERRLLREKMHQLSLKRALTMAGVFSPKDRAAIREKMNLIFYGAPRPQSLAIMQKLRDGMGFKFRSFYIMYVRTVDALDAYSNHVMNLKKR